MATLEQDPSSGRYRVRFRYEGRAYKRTTRTKNYRSASSVLSQVEETLRLLELGLTSVPDNIDPGKFIVSGARYKREQLPKSPVRSLSDLFDTYQAGLPSGAKEKNTLRGEKLHMRHFLRHLKPSTPVRAITTNVLQKYIEKRSNDQHRGRTTGPNTIKKEITTFKLIWNWAIKQGYLEKSPPVAGLIYPKRDEKSHFMTMAEIERMLSRSEVVSNSHEIWESLYLTKPEISGMLNQVRQAAMLDFIYPMFLLAAHTGMRRSELVRAEVNDFNFDNRTIIVREKKRSRKHGLSFRRVPMTELVAKTFRSYLSTLPEGYAVLSRSNEPKLAEDTITHFFKITLRNSRWEKVRGFHVLRHSFASNAASEGIDQRMIDEWMGHQTEEMRRRYRHLTPSSQVAAIDTLY